MRTLPFSWRVAATLIAPLLIFPSCRQAATAVAPFPVLQSKSFERALPGCGDKTKREEPCVTFSVKWVELTSGASEEVRKSINQVIEAQLHPVQGAPPAFEQESAAFIDAYRKLKAEYPEMPLAWFDRRTVDVLLNDGQLLSVAVERKSFNGGPRAEESGRMLCFRLSDGQVLKLGDLLQPQKLADFNKRADKRLRLDRGIDPDVALEEMAIMLNGRSFSDCQDVAVLPRGLQLHYDPGVIGITAVGAIDILLSWEEVAPSLRPNTPLAHLAGR